LRSIGRIVVDALRAEGVGCVFCVPGESYLPVLDAFNDVSDVRLVTAQHEEGAGFMAHAWAKATGLPGVAMVTRGPGVTHATIALHAAQQDRTPFVLFAGDVPRANLGRESFQEVDMVGLGELLGSGGIRIMQSGHAADQLQTAFRLAREGRPGPVVVSLPEDVGDESAEVTEPRTPNTPRAEPSAETLAHTARLLEGASSVALIAGARAGWSETDSSLVELANELGTVVYAAWRQFDAFPNDHPLFAGNLPWLSAELTSPLHSADVVLVVGTRLCEFTTLGYRIPCNGQALIHVDTSPDATVAGDCAAATARLLELVRVQPEGPRERRREAALRAGARYAASWRPPAAEQSGLVDLPNAVATLRHVLPADAAIAGDAGIHSAYLNRYFRWLRPRTFFGTTSGAMGYAIPGAIGAKLAHPTRLVVGVAGDGGFAMTMSEIRTACRLGLSGVVFVVFDNGVLGSIKRHQTRRFPGREIGVELGTAGFDQVAEGLGALGLRATDNYEFEEALYDAIAADVPVVIQALTAPDQIDAWD